MVRFNSTGARLAASLSALFVTIIVGFFITRPLIAERLLSRPPLRSELLKATSYEDQNPEHHYHLAQIYYYDLLSRDVGLARDSFLKAISLNPVSAMYWLGLASALDSKGEAKAARSALARARYLNRSYAKIRWMEVNLLLKEGAATEKLVFELGHIIKDFPKERGRAFIVLHRVTGDDTARILEDAIPRELKPTVAYLLFLISRKDTPGVIEVWNSLADRFDISKKLATRYINYLVSVGDVSRAREYFDDYEGRSTGELILNGGFEDDICDYALCWKIAKISGAVFRVDESVFSAGRRSLKIEFDGSENVDFRHISIPLSLTPGLAYRLSAFIKTETLSTTNGFFLQLYGTSGCKLNVRTKALTGTNPWQEVSVDFSVPLECESGVVRLRRLKSAKLDNRIKGKVWVDSVRLVERGVPAGGETLKVEGAL